MRENSKVGLIGKRISQETKLSLLSSSRFIRNYSRRRGLLSEYTINNARVNSVDRRPTFLSLSPSLRALSLEYYAAASAPRDDRYTSECCAGTRGRWYILIDARAPRAYTYIDACGPCSLQNLYNEHTMVLCTDHYELLPLRSLSLPSSSTPYVLSRPSSRHNSTLCTTRPFTFLPSPSDSVSLHPLLSAAGLLACRAPNESLLLSSIESSPISGKRGRGRNFRDSFERLEGYINFRWRFSRSLIKEGVEGSLRKKGEGRLLYLIRKLYSFRGLALFD